MCSIMLLHLRLAVPCNDDGAALSVCIRFACSAACYNPAQSVAVLLESYGQSCAAACRIADVTSVAFSSAMQC